jgi:hypothetical protein
MSATGESDVMTSTNLFAGKAEQYARHRTDYPLGWRYAWGTLLPRR